MRILNLFVINQNYLDRFYKKNNYIKSSDELFKLYDKDCFSWCGAWRDPFKELGYEVYELYPNDVYLKELRLIELGLDTDISIKEWIEVEINNFKPDIIFTDDTTFFHSDIINSWREKFKNILYYFGHVCSPYHNINDLKSYDCIFTCLNYFQDKFIQEGVSSIYLPHAFNTNILNQLSSNQIKNKKNIVFIGNVFKGTELHNYREELLLYLADEGLLDIYSEIYYYSYIKEILKNSFKFLLNQFYTIIKKIRLQNLIVNNNLFRHLQRTTKPDFNFLNRKLKKIAKKPVYGIELYSILNSNMLNLNIHAGVAKNEAANVRMFEVTGVGSLLITDHKDNINSLFEPDVDLITYKTKEEALEKVLWAINNPDLVEKIATNGKTKVLKMHTFYNRADQIDTYIKSLINNKK